MWAGNDLGRVEPMLKIPIQKVFRKQSELIKHFHLPKWWVVCISMTFLFASSRKANPLIFPVLDGSLQFLQLEDNMVSRLLAAKECKSFFGRAWLGFPGVSFLSVHRQSIHIPLSTGKGGMVLEEDNFSGNNKQLFSGSNLQCFHKVLFHLQHPKGTALDSSTSKAFLLLC